MYVFNPVISEQLNYDHKQEHAYHCELLNEDQWQAYIKICESIKNNHGKLFFLNGHGGTGKTFLYKVLCSKFQSKGAIVICVASSGIVALLLPLGCTVHSTFKILIDTLHEDSVCKIVNVPTYCVWPNASSGIRLEPRNSMQSKPLIKHCAISAMTIRPLEGWQHFLEVTSSKHFLWLKGVHEDRLLMQHFCRAIYRSTFKSYISGKTCAYKRTQMLL